MGRPENIAAAHLYEGQRFLEIAKIEKKNQSSYW